MRVNVQLRKALLLDSFIQVRVAAGIGLRNSSHPTPLSPPYASHRFQPVTPFASSHSVDMVW